MSTIKHLIVWIVIAQIGGYAYAEDPLFAEDSKLFESLFTQYKRGEIGSDDLFDRVLSESNDKWWAVVKLFANKYYAKDDRYFIRLLSEANSVCLLPPDKREVHFIHSVNAEDALIATICEASTSLAERNKKAIGPVLRKANEQCRYIIEFCSDINGIPESRLLDVIEKSDSYYIKNRALGILNTRPDIVDKKRTEKILKIILEDIVMVGSNGDNVYDIKKCAIGELKRLGIDYEANRKEGDLQVEDRTVALGQSKHEKTGNQTPEHKKEEVVKPIEDIKKKTKGTDWKTISIVAGAVATFVLLGLLVAMKPWKR